MSNPTRKKLMMYFKKLQEDPAVSVGALPLVSASPFVFVSHLPPLSQIQKHQKVSSVSVFAIVFFSLQGGGRGFAGVIEGGRRGIEIGSVGKFEALIGCIPLSISTAHVPLPKSRC